MTSRECRIGVVGSVGTDSKALIYYYADFCIRETFMRSSMRSLGIFCDPPPSEATSDEPFGFHDQGNSSYPIALHLID